MLHQQWLGLLALRWLTAWAGVAGASRYPVMITHRLRCNIQVSKRVKVWTGTAQPVWAASRACPPIATACGHEAEHCLLRLLPERLLLHLLLGACWVMDQEVWQECSCQRLAHRWVGVRRTV